MPPKSRITREMIVNAGFTILREYGADSLNARKIASELKCSTQPVMYQFSTIEELKAEVYAEADKFHSSYIMTPTDNDSDHMLSIGMRYISFAAEEKHLFRFLFQSDKYAGRSLNELTDSPELEPIYDVLEQEAGITAEQIKEAFSALFLTVHGIAALLANNSMEFDRAYLEKLLTNVFNGVIGVMAEENAEKGN